MAFDSHIRDTMARRSDRMWTAGRRYGLALAALALASLSESASAQVLPPDAKATCALDPTGFSRWFEGGRVQKDGVVTPADSLNSPPDSDCDFYKWGERMFLWLTSPDRAGGKVFQSSVFFGVSPPGPDRKRTFLQTARDKITISFSLRTPKPVEHGGLPGRQRGVLMSQNKSLVYSATMVNEVYAYLLTGKRHNRITLDRFPVLDDDMAKIIQFASDQGFTITQPNILALQVKTAWVDTARFREFNLDPSKYLTIRAEIPSYTADAANSRLTPTPAPNQTREAELALVGMHVVGSIRGGSGLVWATFEHVDNVPIQPYYYAPADGGEPREFRPQPAPDKKWLFSEKNCVDPNRMRMHARNPPHIDFEPGFSQTETTIGPSDTCRENAWGSLGREDRHVAANTHIISLNDSIGRMLDGGDVRKNYMLIGAIWNFNEGATNLANSTLETYEQQNGGCLDVCHKGELDQGNLSHMFIPLQPLPLRR